VRFRAPTCVHGDSEPFLFEMRIVFSGAPCIGALGNAGAPMGMGYATTPLSVLCVRSSKSSWSNSGTISQDFMAAVTVLLIAQARMRRFVFH
jgi:hypothetical protein